MDISFMAFKLPLSSRSLECVDPKPIRSLASVPTRLTTRCRRTSVTVNGTGGGSAKYRGTQMRENMLTDLIEIKVAEAEQVCKGDIYSDECKVAWDEVEEVSQAKADLRRKLEDNKDPLQSFCEENPETDECRIYDD